MQQIIYIMYMFICWKIVQHSVLVHGLCYCVKINLYCLPKFIGYSIVATLQRASSRETPPTGPPYWDIEMLLWPCWQETLLGSWGCSFCNPKSLFWATAYIFCIYTGQLYGDFFTQAPYPCYQGLVSIHYQTRLQTSSNCFEVHGPD